MTKPQHYRMTLPDAIALYKAKLISATALMYFFLQIRLKHGWKMTLHQREISKKLGISKASFYKAIARLKEKNLIDFEAPNGLVVTLSEIGQSGDALDESETIGQIVDSLDRSETSLDKSETQLDRSETSLDKSETQLDRSETEAYLKASSDKGCGVPSNSYQISNSSLSPFSQGEEEKANISNTPEAIANNSSLSKTSGGLQKIECSAAPLNFESSEIHWALDYHGEEPTPWLEPPQSKRNNIIFNAQFLRFFGDRWLKAFNKADFYQAKADFRSSLLNDPDRIPGRWQEYSEHMGHFAGSTATAAQLGAKIPEADIEKLHRHQKAITHSTAEEFAPSSAIAPEIEQKLLPQPVAVGDVGRKLLPQKTTGDLIVEAALRSGELKKVPRGGGFKWYPGFPADINKFRWFQSAEDWLAEVEKEEVW